MEYDFDSPIDPRRARWKWARWPGRIPMWVADCDYKIAPLIVEAVQRTCCARRFGL